MQNLIIAAKGAFVLATGFASAVVGGASNTGISAGEMLTGGGGVVLGLAILRAANEVGKLRQMIDNHENRIGRLERNEDTGR